MRKLIYSALMILCLSLTACGGGGQQQMEDTIEKLTTATHIAMTAALQVDLGETVESYGLDYALNDEVWTVLVTAPDCAAGIIARITEGGSELEYDGAILPTGDLLDEGIRPIAALPLLVEMLDNGFLEAVWTEGEQIVGRVQYSDTLGATLWLDAAGTPVAAELMEKGIVKAACTFSDVQIEGYGHELTDKTDLGGDFAEESGT